MSNKNSNGSVPDHVINQLGEHTVGGFILFYFNNLTGEPEQVMTFDSPAHSLALQKHIADWNEAIHEVNLGQSVLSLQQAVLETIKEDEEDEEE